MRRSAAVLLSLFFVSAVLPTTALAGPASGSRPGGRSVCVLPAVGDKLAVVKQGITVFGNDFAEAAIGAWGIDDLIARKIGALLGKEFAVRRISFPMGAIAAIDSANGKLIRDREQELREAVRGAAAASARCDLYVAVAKAAMDRSNSALVGLSIIDASGLAENVSLHAMIRVTVYDGSSFAILQRKLLESRPRSAVGILTGTELQGLHLQVDKSWWPASTEAVVRDARIRESVRTLIEQGLAGTMPGLL